MHTRLGLFGRSAPFIFLAASLAPSAYAAPQGHWRLDGDGTEIELRACAPGSDLLCGFITRLPRSADALPAADRKALCGMALLYALRPEKPRDGEQARFAGRVLDLDAMAPDGRAPEYGVRYVVLSDAQARFEVQNALGLVVDRLTLTRVRTPASGCA